MSNAIWSWALCLFFIPANMPIKLRQLNHLLALEQYGSFIHAAVALHLTQPALSRSIQSLETQVGAPLFLREGHGVVPTDLGRVLIQHARQITRMTDTLHEVIGNPALNSQDLVLGAGPFPGNTIVSRAVARFVDTHPRIKLRVEIRNWDELLPRLRSQELNLFVAETSTLEGEQDLEIEPMARHPIYFLARPGHPLAGQPAPDIGAVFSHPIISPSRVPPRVLDPVLAAIARTTGLQPEAHAFPALLCSDFSIIKQVVVGSNALMASTLASVRTELERGELVVLGGEPWMHLHYGLVIRKASQPVSAALLTLRDYLLEAERMVCEEEKALLARWKPTL